MTDLEKKIMGAVRALREHAGLNQSAFGQLIGKQISTVQRWENIAAPPMEALPSLYRAAMEAGREELAVVFQEGLIEALGRDGISAVLAAQKNTGNFPDTTEENRIESGEIRIWAAVAARAVKVQNPAWRRMLASILKQLQEVADVAEDEAAAGTQAPKTGGDSGVIGPGVPRKNPNKPTRRRDRTKE